MSDQALMQLMNDLTVLGIGIIITIMYYINKKYSFCKSKGREDGK